MQIELDIPDELLTCLTPAGQEPARAALEAWGLEAYRQRRLSAFQLRTLLGIPSRWDLDGFLKEHRVETYGVEELQQDLATIRESREQYKLNRPA